MAEPIGSFSGLASGIQWQDMIDQMIQIERAPIRRLEARVTSTKAEATAWKAFKANVQALRDALAGLAGGSALRAVTTSIRGLPEGTPATVSVTAGADAQPGTVRVRTVAVARAEKLGGAVFAERDAALGIAGELHINGRAVTISATDSLSQIAASINAANTGTDGVGASATVLRTPEGEYRLVLTSATTGAAGMSLADDGSGVLAALGLDAPTVITAGADAQLEIDGALYTSASNTFEGILDGVTFTATFASEYEVEVELTRDTTKAAESVKQLVDALNELAKFVKSQTGSAPLAGNGPLRSMHSGLRSALLDDVDLGDGRTARLSTIGIEVDRNGTYSLDAERFEAALRSDPRLVEEVLGGSAGIGTRMLETADRYLGYGNGSIDGLISDLEGRVPGIENRIASLESRFDDRRANLVRRFAALEQALAQAQSQSAWLASQLTAFQGAGRS